jgi:quinone-modifying oxidoreductase, subunit QmoC
MAILAKSRADHHARSPQAADFGWRLHGRPIRVLHDSSLTLLASRQRSTATLLAQYSADGNSLMSCLQCGACTVNCRLAEASGVFPRRQMTLLQLGEVDRLVEDPKVWFCFNCQDCTSSCPANAGPGRIMATIRRLAVEHYSLPRGWSRLANRPWGLVCMFVAAVALLLAITTVGGSFSPQVSPVRYASMLPHFTLDLFFGTVAGIVMITALAGAARAWKAFTGQALWKANAVRLANSLVAVTRQILTHQDFAQCQQFPLSRWAHISVFFGFMTLVALAGVAAMLIAVGAPYPLPASHPLKIVGNFAAAWIIAGCLYFWSQRQRASRNKNASSWFDWALLLELLLVCITGVLAEVFRYANVAALAYPTYFSHLVFVLVLLAGWASSKLAHGIYRTVALTAEQYTAITEAPLQDFEPGRVAA